jgi:hypothetical protein
MSEARHQHSDACEHFLDRLDAWLAGEIGDEAGASMQTHHDSCDHCRQEARLALAIDGITRALPEHDLPALVRPSAQLPRSQNGRNGFLEHLARLVDTWRQPLVYAPALLLGGLLIVLVMQTGPTPAPQTVTVDGVEYSQAEILRAAADLEIALRYLDKYGTIPARVVHAELQEQPLAASKNEEPTI